MTLKVLPRFVKAILIFQVCFLSACGGGGGGDDSAVSTVGGAGDRWLVLANVSKNGCGERISNVQQTFILGPGVINTSLVTIPVTNKDSGFEFSFSESNGGCTRTYTGTFSNVSGSSATVDLISDTDCGAVKCENTWTGTASRS